MNPKYLLDAYEIAPKKSLGQNFLQDAHILGKIVTAAELKPGDTVLEIGAGTGALTVALAQTHAQVVALEIDDRLLPILQRQLGDFPNVEIVHGDIEEVDPVALVGGGEYTVVANLPYYITSKIIRLLLESVSRKPRRLVLTIQQEVAERIVAKPGDMSLLAVSVQFYGKAEIVTKINPGAFFPRPEVASAVIRIDPHIHPLMSINEEVFFEVVRAGFSQKRKQLKNSLGFGLGISHLEAAQILLSVEVDPSRRAETLNIEEWGALAHAVARTLPRSESGRFRPSAQAETA